MGRTKYVNGLIQPSSSLSLRFKSSEINSPLISFLKASRANIPLQSPERLSLNRGRRAGNSGWWSPMIRDLPVPPPVPSLCRHRLGFCRRCDAASDKKIRRGLPSACLPGSLSRDESCVPSAQPSLACQFPGAVRSLATKNLIVQTSRIRQAVNRQIPNSARSTVSSSASLSREV